MPFSPDDEPRAAPLPVDELVRDLESGTTLEELRRHIRRRRFICERDGMSRVAERVQLGGGTMFETVQFGLSE